MTTALAPLLTMDRRDGDGYGGLSASEIDYARLLNRSGFGSWTIADALRIERRVLESIAHYRGWTRATLWRRAPDLIGIRVPLLVRCGICAARFGEELGASRPCPHCGALERGDAHG